MIDPSQDIQSLQNAIDLGSAITDVERRQFGPAQFRSMSDLNSPNVAPHPAVKAADRVGIEMPIYSTDGDYFVVTNDQNEEKVLTTKENLQQGTLIQYIDHNTNAEYTGIVVKDPSQSNQQVVVKPITKDNFNQIRRSNPNQRIVRIKDDSFKPKASVPTKSAKRLASMIPILEPAEKLIYFIYAKIFGDQHLYNTDKIAESYLLLYLSATIGGLVILFFIWVIAESFV